MATARTAPRPSFQTRVPVSLWGNVVHSHSSRTRRASLLQLVLIVPHFAPYGCLRGAPLLGKSNASCLRFQFMPVPLWNTQEPFPVVDLVFVTFDNHDNVVVGDPIIGDVAEEEAFRTSRNRASVVRLVISYTNMRTEIRQIDHGQLDPYVQNTGFEGIAYHIEVVFCIPGPSNGGDDAAAEID
ncbi:hypothetical protein BU26DRAFT_501478 [Trematosphaeria pertusa]|uniref:Uncharacterized protein n=1 Tax=Trematosphaeria pertusa TaxID=390896 RepID=A0A6A6IS85_9PLEO|nr:uncharacterized protein BU26DRAFT_501478 [Trematosphaeria pertusa]KAF2253266.1 hypothetical protein BU26DRAFT_501478 [Trematosphaeria pertusa]